MLHPDLDPKPEPTSEARRLANKYRDVDSLESGYLELQSHSNQQHQKIQELEERLQSMSVNSRSAEREHDPIEALDELGIPVDDVKTLIQREVEARLRPIMEAQTARTAVSRTFPEFEKIENDVAQWLSQNRAYSERYGRMFQVDQAGAMEWAITAYQREHKEEPDVRRNPDVGLSGSGGGTRYSGSDRAADEALKAEFERAQETRNWDRYIRIRLEQGTPDSHFEGLSGQR